MILHEEKVDAGPARKKHISTGTFHLFEIQGNEKKCLSCALAGLLLANPKPKKRAGIVNHQTLTNHEFTDGCYIE